jgi:peroxiredoxin
VLIALKEGQFTAAKEQLAKAGSIPKERLARLQFAAGDKSKAVQLAQEAAKSAEKQVQPLANYVDLAYQAGQFKEAFDAFFKLRELSAEADLDTPVFRRLAPVAKDLKLAADWRPPLTRPSDFGKRPSLSSLGPFRWQPPVAPDFTLTDGEGKKVSLRQYRGRPVVVIFYLGAGCAHCIEQLVAFAPLAAEFKQAGIELLAVSTDTAAGLQFTVEKAKYNGGFPIRLAADPGLKAFKAFRAHDDFEQQPLHGTFLVDGEGHIRWQDISYQPFMETKFLLGEGKRLLNLPKSNGAVPPMKLAGQKQDKAAVNCR